MSDSRKSLRKQQRPWEDLQDEKKSYLNRKQEEKEAERALKDFQRHLEQDDTSSGDEA